MKNELATSIVIAIVGVVIAYFACNLLAGEIKPFSIKTVDDSVTTSLSDPDPEVFNYRALNPTVEVYVGDCVNGGENCKDESSGQIDSSTVTNGVESEVENTNNQDN